MEVNFSWTAFVRSANITSRGASTRGEGPAPHPLELENTIFSVFFFIDYAICIIEVCVLKLFAMWEK